MSQFPFNVRVYGIVTNEDSILVCDEHRVGMDMTKFIGGGLEFGEGTIECLKREFQEELSIDVDVKRHLYTTDFFQKSAFNDQHQILSIYYEVELLSSIDPLLFGEKQFDFDRVDGALKVRWIKKDSIHESDLSFPIDKLVLKFLR